MENEEPDTLEIHLDLILRDKKRKNLNQVIKKALADKGFLNELLHDLVYKDETYRYNCFKVWCFKIIDYFIKLKWKEKKK